MSEIYQLEMVQNRAVMSVANRYWNSSSVGDMSQHLNWRCLEDRRNIVVLSWYKRKCAYLWDNYSTFIDCLSLSLLAKHNKDKNRFTRTIFEWNRPPQPRVLGRSIEIFTATVSSIKHRFKKPVNRFNIFRVCATSHIIFANVNSIC